MANQVIGNNGQLSTNVNPSVGSVLYGNDFLDQHTKNIEMLTEDPFDKYWKLKQAEEAKKIRDAKLADDITKDLTVNYKGAMPEDIETEFKPRASELLKQYADLVKSGMTNEQLQRSGEYQKIRAGLNELKGDIEQSGDFNKAIIANKEEWMKRPDNYDEGFASNVASFRTLPSFKERQKEFSTRGGVFLNPSVPNLEKDIDATWRSVAPTMYDIKRTTENRGGQVVEVESKTVNHDRLLGLAGSIVLSNPSKVDKVWNNLNPIKQAAFEDAARIESLASGKQIDPKTYMIYSESLKPRVGETDKEMHKGFTPYARASAGDAVKQQQANGMYDALNAMEELNPDVFVRGVDGNIAKVGGNYVSTTFNGLNYGTRQVNYDTGAVDDNGKKIMGTATVPNRIIAVYIDPTNRNTYKIRTDKDAAEHPNEPLFASVEVPKQEFGYTLFSSNYKDAVEGLSRLQKAAAPRKDVTKQGVVVPTQTISTEKIVGGEPTSQYQANVTTQGVPVKKKETTVSKKKIGNVEYELKSVGQEQLPLVTSQSDYDNLPKGTKYTNSKGQIGVKK